MFDIIVVGARCSGASAAMLLARKGYRVAMIDKDPPGSDMLHSTHIVQPIAVSKLKKWELLANLEAECPSFESYSFDFGVALIDGKPPAVDGDARAFCPRRKVLDPILVSAAVSEGVTYMPSTKVIDVTRTGERVDGVRFVTAGGAEQTIKGELVIGADGPGSTIAARVNARQYREASAQQVTMWGYWSGIPGRGLDVKSDGGRAVWLIPSSGGDSMVGVSWEMTRYKSLRGEVKKGYYASIAELSPLLSTQLKQDLLSSELRVGSTRTYLRAPHGPGWVLLGDAGHTKDPCSAQGITDAFIDVDECTSLIDAGLRGERNLDEGLADWHVARDARLIPFLEMSLKMAQFQPPDESETALYQAIAKSDAATTQFLGLISESTNPGDFFAAENIGRLLAS